jgi:uncharacterized membrane protein YozB (DUF420 family)
MEKNKLSIYLVNFVFVLLFILTIPTIQVFASNNQDMPFLDPNHNSSKSDWGEQIQEWTFSINEKAPEVSMIFSTIFSIMFLIGILKMGYSLVTKTGSVMKEASSLLIWVPVVVFLIRIISIFMFTTNEHNITLLLSDLFKILQSLGIYLSIGLVLVGLVMHLFYKFLNHPDYGRWSKRLWVSSLLLGVMTGLMPIVIGGV